jgi:hypothetical protein
MAQSLTQAEILSFLGPGYLDPDSFSYSKDLEEVQEIFQGKTKEEALELLEDLERTEFSEELHQDALIAQSAEQPSEEGRLAVVDSSLRPTIDNPYANLKIIEGSDSRPQIVEPAPSLILEDQVEDQVEDDPYANIILSDEPTDKDFSHISTNRRVQFGADREPMIAGILWDMGKAKIRALRDGDKTYAQAMDEVSVENLEKVYQEFPEFRGVSF